MSTPREKGYRMPAEWAHHTRCWMAWPCREELWGEHLDAARRATADVARAIAEFEPVTMIARPELTASVSLYCGSGVTVLPLPQDDSWARDTGPTFLQGPAGELAGVCWQFNGWGELYENYAQDAQMAQRVLAHLGVEAFRAPIVLEGGGVHVDGEGTCLVCTTSVLDPRRNPGLGAAAAEAILKDHLGVARVVWLPAGLADDETGGHVDNVACFARPGTVLLHMTEDEGDPNHAVAQANLEALRGSTDARGRPLEIVTLPQPRARARASGGRLTMSYVNFYIANGGIVMPGFADAADTTAFRTISQLFPDRRVIQVDVPELLEGGGGIHCITQQQPAPA